MPTKKAHYSHRRGRPGRWSFGSHPGPRAVRKLGFLVEHSLVCGLFYGDAVDQFMTLIVLPLSALHAKGPYDLRCLILGLVLHSILIGLPISFSVRRFAK